MKVTNKINKMILDFREQTQLMDEKLTPLIKGLDSDEKEFVVSYVDTIEEAINRRIFMQGSNVDNLKFLIGLKEKYLCVQNYKDSVFECDINRWMHYLEYEKDRDNEKSEANHIFVKSYFVLRHISNVIKKI